MDVTSHEYQPLTLSLLVPVYCMIQYGIILHKNFLGRSVAVSDFAVKHMTVDLSLPTHTRIEKG